jgi:peptidoglycan/LPS O-acetylase OafA/YrhL
MADSQPKQIYWINTLKAICMISVYVLHSEAYYGARVTYGYFLYPFYVNAFFFISGYLFF